MPSQIVPIHRTNTDGNCKKKDDVWFNAFDFSSGQDSNIRWLSRPNQQFIQGRYSSDTEKFRITFDVENFKAEQIKIYIQNRRLTITGVYEEHSEGRFMQKQFERTFDIPVNGDVDAMASFITPNHMLVVEIPLNTSTQIDQLSIEKNAMNNQRRLSFSLNKFNDSTNQDGSLSTSGQSVRRTSITKTTTRTTTTGSAALPSEAVELLKNIDSLTGDTSQTYNKQTIERHSSNTANQLNTNDQNSSTNLPIDSTQCKTSSTTTQNTHQTGNVPITRTDNQSSTNGTNQNGSVSVTRNNEMTLLNQQQTNTNKHRMFTFEEFLQNTTWNPSVRDDGANGKKMLHMRLQMKSGTTSDQMKVSLNGYDLRVEVDNKLSNEGSRQISGNSYRQVTLFSTCDVSQLKTELKDDGFLHIQVPITI